MIETDVAIDKNVTHTCQDGVSIQYILPSSSTKLPFHKIIKSIAQNGATFATKVVRDLNLLKLNDSSLFLTKDKYWCGYNHPTISTPRTSCQ